VTVVVPAPVAVNVVLGEELAPVAIVTVAGTVPTSGALLVKLMTIGSAAVWLLGQLAPGTEVSMLNASV
jgi:hypothetical protein